MGVRSVLARRADGRGGVRFQWVSDSGTMRDFLTDEEAEGVEFVKRGAEVATIEAAFLQFEEKNHLWPALVPLEIAMTAHISSSLRAAAHSAATRRSSPRGRAASAWRTSTAT